MIKFFAYCWDMLLTSGAWLISSFLICGFLHALLRPDTLQRSLGNKKVSSIIKATVSGMLLPICSCGVVPLTLGLYYSGAYLGPTLAFLVATPIINPAAVIISFALLGPDITLIYLVCGFVLPFIIGFLANKFGSKELFNPTAVERSKDFTSKTVSKQSFLSKLKGGMIWGFQDLALQTCRFILVGAIFASFLLIIIPPSFIQTYLAEPKLVSVIGAAVLGAIMYICALGHIPFVAAIIAAGAAPGIAITFLLSGVATNLPEMISIWKMIGKRAVIIYTGCVVIFSIVVGHITNRILLTNFMPKFDLTGSNESVNFVNNISIVFPEPFKIICASLVIAMGLYSWFKYFERRYVKH